MKRSTGAMRQRIFANLIDHLKAIYHIEWPRKMFGNGEISKHDVDALVAFKSDPQLDELHAAFIRVENQKFGVCIRCTQDIDQHLLDEDPTRRLCVECEKEVSRPPSTEMDSAHGLRIGHQARLFTKPPDSE